MAEDMEVDGPHAQDKGKKDDKKRFEIKKVHTAPM
jgi:hypothetical protein